MSIRARVGTITAMRISTIEQPRQATAAVGEERGPRRQAGQGGRRRPGGGGGGGGPVPPGVSAKGKSEEKPAVPSRKDPMPNTASDVDRSRSAAGGEGSRSWSTVADRANSEATDVASRQLRKRNDQLMSETERMHGRMRELEIKLREKDKVRFDIWSRSFFDGVNLVAALSGLEFISLTSIFLVTSLLDTSSRPRTRGCATGWAS